MGGKIFEGTRAVTLDDVDEIKKKMIDYSGYFNRGQFDWAIVGSYNNLQAMGRTTMGDIDLVVYRTKDFYRRQQLLKMVEDEALPMASRLFGDEIKPDGKNSVFVKWNGIQIDFRVVDSIPAFDWIRSATTVPSTDVFKPLYRNELLFHLPRYHTVEAPEVNSENRVVSFRRRRFTLWDGPMHSTYSFVGEKGDLLKKATRTDVAGNSDFEDFLTDACQLPEWVAENPTFSNIVAAVKKGAEKTYGPGTKLWKRLQEDTVNALLKKGAPIPGALL